MLHQDYEIVQNVHRLKIQWRRWFMKMLRQAYHNWYSKINQVNVTIWKIRNRCLQAWNQDRRQVKRPYKRGLNKTYQLIWGQWSDPMIYQIESIADFNQIKINVGPIGLQKKPKASSMSTMQTTTRSVLYIWRSEFLISRRSNQGLIKRTYRNSKHWSKC